MNSGLYLSTIIYCENPAIYIFRDISNFTVRYAAVNDCLYSTMLKCWEGVEDENSHGQKLGKLKKIFMHPIPMTI